MFALFLNLIDNLWVFISCRAVASVMSTLVFPLFLWLLQLLVTGWFVLVVLYLASSTHPVYKAAMDGCTCRTPNGTYVVRNHLIAPGVCAQNPHQLYIRV